MARASTRTLIPLDSVPAALGINPMHFNGVISHQLPSLNACDDIWYQHPWQAFGRLGREDMAFALHQAEQRTVDVLNFLPVPDWSRQEDHRVPLPATPELYTYAQRDSRGMAKSINLERGYFIAGGQRGSTLIEAGVAVTYSDPDGDGFDEQGNVSVATTVTDNEEIAVFYPGEAGSLLWEIRPIDVSIAGGTATITFKKWQAVLPELLDKQGYTTNTDLQVDGDDNTNFLTAVDVYRVYHDDSQQIIFYADPEMSCSSSISTEQTATGVLLGRDVKLGMASYRYAQYSGGSWSSYDPAIYPTRMEVWYRSGYRNHELERPFLEMDPTLRWLIINYAVTLLDRIPAACDNIQNHIKYMSEDLAEVVSNEAGSKQYQMTFEMMNNRFNTTRAGFNLYRHLKDMRIEK